ncbi:L,D-transpeptidase [Patescibacteria group bacterium]|nr:L,D-transpeptidase [Patescibacteria group bacterium]
MSSLIFSLALSILRFLLFPVSPSLPAISAGVYDCFRSLPQQTSLVQVGINSTIPSVLAASDSSYRVEVDISDNREYIYEDDRLIKENVVSTGSATRFEIPYHTPLGLWKLISKESAGGVYGPYFLRLAKWNGSSFVTTAIGLHGTNEPELLGHPASHGCIRHDNRVITELYELLPLETLIETRE